jgi:hypothetical protein
MTATKIPPKPGKETIYLDVDDEITSIISKVEASKEKVVALVLPKRASSLQSIVNMRLLKRSADAAGKSPVLITGESALLPLAGAAGLHVAKTLQSKPEIPAGPDALENPPPETDISGAPAELDELPQKIDYEKSIGELAAAHDVDSPEAIPLDDEDDEPPPPKLPKTPKDKKLKVPNFDRFRVLIGAGILGFVALVIFLFLAIFVLPKAEVIILTTSTPVSGNFTLTTSGTAESLDQDKKIIPSKLMTSDQTAKKEVQATGQKNLGKKASGSITMRTANCTGTLPSSVPAGTGASSSGGTFITQQQASFAPTVDGGGNCYYTSGSVGVIAQQAGSKYNLAAGSTFSIAGRSSLTASNSDAFSGGTDDNVTVLSQEDVDKVRQEISSEESDEFLKAFKKDLDEDGHYILDSTLKLGDPAITASPAVGQQTSSSNVSVKITYTVLTVKKEDLKKFLEDNLNSQIKDSSQKLSGDVLKDANISVQSQKSPTDATLNIGIETTAVPVIDTAAVKKQVKGQKKGNIQSSLSVLPGVKDVQVRLSPFWVSKVPNKEGKITIILKQEAEPDNNSDGE